MTFDAIIPCKLLLDKNRSRILFLSVCWYFCTEWQRYPLNDESRRISEDMQQFHLSSPNTDLSDHYYWEDILDAETDRYLDKD